MLISEVARRAGMSKDGVRHYEDLGLIASSPRRAGSRTYRDYDPSVLAVIDRVRQAQRLGFPLKEIGPLLRAYAEGPPSEAETVAFLEARLAVIRARMAELGEVEAFILHKLELHGRLACPRAAGADG